MPAKSEKQRRFMGAELSRARAGKKTRTGMSEDKLSEFTSKSIDMINAYLFKHGRILPCGHHAEEGSDVDKACTMSNCGGVGGIGHAPGASYTGGTEGKGYQGTEGIYGSMDPIELINNFLDKQSRFKCKHKKDDPNHLEAA
jgi:hypothetical protein